MIRGRATLWALGLAALFAVGCGDSFDEGRAKPLPGGIKVIELKDGSGEPVAEADRVEVHYEGWLRDSGNKFDSSYLKNRTMPVTLGAGDVIPGFDLGLEGMRPGGKRRVFIPSQLGYGPKGAGRDIPPNADLVFDIELVKVTERAGKVKITDLKEGTGPAVKPRDKVTVHYTGTLVDGTKFDSSLDRNEPFQLEVGAGQVIKGWDQGLVGARKGGKRRLEIPSHLAYGPQGRPPKIPPNAPLVFEIEVVDVEPGPR